MKKTEDNEYAHIIKMESILDEATQLMNELEDKLSELEVLEPEIKELQAYYESSQWKEDFEKDERGEFPEDLKRGVLSEDGIYNVLERYKELRGEAK